MAYSVYLPEDIAANLVAAGVGMFSAAAAHGGGNIEYCRGIYDALHTQAVACRLDWPQLEARLQRELTKCGLEQLLPAVTGSPGKLARLR